MIKLYYCPQCGCETEELFEGYCKDCLRQRQSELDEFNCKFDWWNRLTEKEKDNIIKHSI